MVIIIILLLLKYVTSIYSRCYVGEVNRIEIIDGAFTRRSRYTFATLRNEVTRLMPKMYCQMTEAYKMK
jgi:hypothetical protein